MNLYEIMFTHYAPKDSKTGILHYLVANSDEEVYKWLKNGNGDVYVSYEYSEEDGEMLDDNPFKESIIESRGCMFNDYMEVTDLYYGATQVGWILKKENISQEEIEILKGVGINIRGYEE